MYLEEAGPQLIEYFLANYLIRKRIDLNPKIQMEMIDNL